MLSGTFCTTVTRTPLRRTEYRRHRTRRMFSVLANCTVASASHWYLFTPGRLSKFDILTKKGCKVLHVDFVGPCCSAQFLLSRSTIVRRSPPRPARALRRDLPESIIEAGNAVCLDPSTRSGFEPKLVAHMLLQNASASPARPRSRRVASISV